MSDPNITLFRNYLQEHAQNYFPELGPSLRVQDSGRQARPESTLYRFLVSDNSFRTSLVVKVTTGPKKKSWTHHDRPALAPKTDPSRASQFEYEALRTMHRYFTELQDSRFSAVRVYDHLPAVQCRGHGEVKTA